METGELAEKDNEAVKNLYLRSVEIDESPIATYSLAVLLKFEDQNPQNVEQAESLFSSVASLGADLQSIPLLAHQLQNARVLKATEISGGFLLEVEEIDDCLAYVKVVVRYLGVVCRLTSSCIKLLNVFFNVAL